MTNSLTSLDAVQLQRLDTFQEDHFLSHNDTRTQCQVCPLLICLILQRFQAWQLS